MNIYPVTEDKLDECVAIFIKAYNSPPWNCAWTPEKARQYLSEYLGAPNFVGFLFYVDEELVGATFGHQKTWFTSQQLMIDEFFIAPEHQRKGYGKKLMEHCNQYAKQNNIGIVFLMTNKYMPSYKFYEKTDYTTIEQFVFMFKQVT